MTFGPRPATITSGPRVPWITRSLETIVARRPPQEGGRVLGDAQRIRSDDAHRLARHAGQALGESLQRPERAILGVAFRSDGYMSFAPFAVTHRLLYRAG